MLKIWKGPEMEGAKVGIPTLFVCSDKELQSRLVLQYVRSNVEVRRIYFGAGRTPFYGVSSWREIYDYAFTHSIELVVETRFDQLREFVAAYDSLITTFIIVDYGTPFIYNNLQFKTDDMKVVKLYNATSQTSLDTLKKNNLFTCDVMLLEED